MQTKKRSFSQKILPFPKISKPKSSFLNIFQKILKKLTPRTLFYPIFKSNTYEDAHGSQGVTKILRNSGNPKII